MAVVVCAPDIDDLVEATLFKLVAVVSDVGGKIGVETVCTAQNIVLELELVYILWLLPALSRFSRSISEVLSQSAPSFSYV